MHKQCAHLEQYVCYSIQWSNGVARKYESIVKCITKFTNVISHLYKFASKFKLGTLFNIFKPRTLIILLRAAAALWRHCRRDNSHNNFIHCCSYLVTLNIICVCEFVRVAYADMRWRPWTRRVVWKIPFYWVRARILVGTNASNVLVCTELVCKFQLKILRPDDTHGQNYSNWMMMTKIRNWEETVDACVHLFECSLWYHFFLSE